MRLLLPLLVLVAVGCSSGRARLRTTLAPDSRAEVVITNAERLQVRNGGPGRLQVRLGEEVGIWISPGGRIANAPRGGAARVVLLTEGRRTRVEVSASGSSELVLRSED